MRGSDPQAATFYLAKMLEAGESVTFIARRIMICACEDVGMADPNAIVVATACAQAVERVGMPESNLILAHAATYVATAPKSNSITNAIFAAQNIVRSKNTGLVPLYLRDAHYEGSAELGHTGYLYPHDFPGHYVKQQYLPDEIRDEVFYDPSDEGYEKTIKKRLDTLKNIDN
jgi:putative ATPase